MDRTAQLEEMIAKEYQGRELAILGELQPLHLGEELVLIVLYVSLRPFMCFYCIIFSSFQPFWPPEAAHDDDVI